MSSCQYKSGYASLQINYGIDEICKIMAIKEQLLRIKKFNSINTGIKVLSFQKFSTNGEILEPFTITAESITSCYFYEKIQYFPLQHRPWFGWVPFPVYISLLLSHPLVNGSILIISL